MIECCSFKEEKKKNKQHIRLCLPQEIIQAALFTNTLTFNGKLLAKILALENSG